MVYVASSGNVLYSLYISGSNALFVEYGGRASNARIAAGGTAIIGSHGGEAYNTTICSGGVLSVVETAECYSTTIEYGGYCYAGEKALGGALSSGFGVSGSCYIGYLSPRIARSITLFPRAQFDILGYASNIVIGRDRSLIDPYTWNDGVVRVRSGGKAINVAVNGQIIVEKGGTATIAYNPWQGRDVISNSGATVVYLDRHEPCYLGGAQYGMLSRGDIFEAPCITSGNTALIYSGGIMNSATINHGGYANVFNGGIANETNVNGVLHVNQGGVANAVCVNVNGSIYVEDGGTATIVYNPWQGVIDSGHHATVEYLAPDAKVYVGSSGIVKRGDVINGFSINSRYVAYVFSGGIMNSATVRLGASVDVLSGGITQKTYMNGGILCIANDGLAAETYMSGGTLCVSNGGTATKTVMSQGGEIRIGNGGLAYATTINIRGGMYIDNGGFANEILITRGGYLHIASGGTAANVIWTPCVGDIKIDDGATIVFRSNYSGVYWGNNDNHSSALTTDGLNLGDYRTMHVMNNGLAENTRVCHTSVAIYSGGEANDTIASSGASITVYSDGVANTTVVSSGANMVVYKGGIVNSTTIGRTIQTGATSVSGTDPYNIIYSSGGTLCVKGGTANQTSVYGELCVTEGGVANDTCVDKGGLLYVGYNGIANNTIVHVYLNANICIGSGGTANQTCLSGGGMRVKAGGIANNTSGNYSWGRIYVEHKGLMNSTVLRGGCKLYNYGIVNSISVEGGGYLYIANGGKVTGSVAINGTGVVSAYTGSIIDFDISTVSPDRGARINNFFGYKGPQSIPLPFLQNR